MITCIDADKCGMKRDGDGSILVSTLSPGDASFSCAATSSYDVLPNTGSFLVYSTTHIKPSIVLHA
jgi:hypothetical protein